MKFFIQKAIALIILLSFFTKDSKAQGVFFNNNVFHYWVVAHYPSCVFPDQSIDVTCSDIVNEDTLDLRGLNINDFNGIQYFTSLRYLDISNNTSGSLYLNSLTMPGTLKVFKCRDINNSGGLDLSGLSISANLEYLDVSQNGVSVIQSTHTLPSLPSSLKYLDFSANRIQGALNVPPALDTLICSNNGEYMGPGFVTGISSINSFPSTLKYIACNGNILTSLPALPASLTYLKCDNNIVGGISGGVQTYTGGITSMPALPVNLQYLDCGGNYIPGLPSLPATLLYLGCAGNAIASLPALPSLLKKLVCGGNNLHVLPALPSTLDSLSSSSDSLTTLPSLPQILRYLDVSHNQLTLLPSLPDSLRTLIVYANPPLECLPHLPAHLSKLTTLTIFDPTSIQCIPNSVNGLVSDITTLCTVTNNSNLCVAFPVLSGHVFYDNNSNGIKEPAENYRANVAIQLSNGLETFSNTNGFYNISADSGMNTLTVVAPTYYDAVPATANFNMPTFSSTATQDIALQPNVSIDSLTLSVTPYWQARPGFDQWYDIAYENVGTTVVAPATVFHYDNTRLTFISASNPSVVDNGSSLTLAEGNFTTGQHGGYTAVFNVKPTAIAGDTIFVNVVATAGTATVTDSSYTKITSSLDPNDKSSTPKLSPQQVTAGKYIDYTIRFQNTGSDTAFNIVVTDVLENKLDATTLQMIKTSHPCKVTRNGNNLSFEFLNVLLPDMTTNEPKSHGYIRFRVKPKQTVILGDIIPNNANIYFDFNSPVLTNTTNTVVQLTTVPLSLLSFKALPGTGNSALLFCNTADEFNTSSFDIEQSIDGRIFSRIGNTAARGHGSNTYSYKTIIPSDIVYYRLKMIDIDGRFTYSQVIQVKRNKNAESIVVISNPAKNTLSIIITDATLVNTTANVINEQGVLVKKVLLRDGLQNIDVNDLSTGIYYLKTTVTTKKIIISH